MCRLFGMSAGARRAEATFWLLGAPDSLAVQSHREPDGTGLGWFDRARVARRSRQALPAYADAAFARRAHTVSSTTFVGHVRFASTGVLAARNTHPFVQDGRLFAHNGVVQDLDQLDWRIGPDALGLVHGETDSERLFALITAETRRHGDLESGIRAACAWVAESLPLLSINFVLATASSLWALRYPATHELHLLERRAGSALRHESSLGSRIASDDAERLPVVVIASEPMDDDRAWRALEPGELVRVDEDLTVHSRAILTGPPARPLSLADLSTQARASQAPAPGAAG